MKRAREYVQQHEKLQSELKRLREELAEASAKYNNHGRDANQIALQIICDSLREKLTAAFGADVVGNIRVEYDTYSQLKYPQIFVEYKPLQAAELQWGLNPRTLGGRRNVNVADFCFRIGDKHKRCIHKYKEVVAKKMATAINKRMDQIKQILQSDAFEAAYTDAKDITWNSHGWIMKQCEEEKK